MSKDDSYWLKVAYVIFAALVGVVVWKASGTVGVQTGWIDRYDTVYQTASTVLSVVVALLAVWLLARDRERHDYFLAAIGELRKVTWPSLPDTRRMTIIVCVVVGIFAVILAVFDLIWAKMLGLLLT